MKYGRGFFLLYNYVQQKPSLSRCSYNIWQRNNSIYQSNNMLTEKDWLIYNICRNIYKMLLRKWPHHSISDDFIFMIFYGLMFQMEAAAISLENMLYLLTRYWECINGSQHLYNSLAWSQNMQQRKMMLLLFLATSTLSRHRLEC